MPMVQKSRCSVPMNAMDSVDCENTHATGAKPSSSSPVSASAAESTPASPRNETSAPVRHAKM